MLAFFLFVHSTCGRSYVLLVNVQRTVYSEQCLWEIDWGKKKKTIITILKLIDVKNWLCCEIFYTSELDSNFNNFIIHNITFTKRQINGHFFSKRSQQMSTKINECNASFPSSTDTTHSYFPTSKKNLTSILTGSERSFLIQRLLAFIRKGKFSDFVLNIFQNNGRTNRF